MEPKYNEMKEELTKEEQKFISDFKKLAKRCPKSLWLFAGDGVLHIMKMGSNGKPAVKEDLTIDGNYSVATVRELYADGGGF